MCPWNDKFAGAWYVGRAASFPAADGQRPAWCTKGSLPPHGEGGPTPRGQPRLLRALRTTIDPRLDQLSGGLLCSRGRLAAFAWIPSPRDQIVLRNMLLEHRQIAPPIACSVFELA